MYHDGRRQALVQAALLLMLPFKLRVAVRVYLPINIDCDH